MIYFISPSSQVHARCKFATTYGRKPQKIGYFRVTFNHQGKWCTIRLNHSSKCVIFPKINICRSCAHHHINVYTKLHMLIGKSTPPAWGQYASLKIEFNQLQVNSTLLGVLGRRVEREKGIITWPIITRKIHRIAI